ncbi:MAG TPA: hypothetical protein VKA74_02945 [Myxococcota bacterium]|nr:hypothetical protein [Myxococcota bacterium]
MSRSLFFIAIALAGGLAQGCGNDSSPSGSNETASASAPVFATGPMGGSTTASSAGFTSRITLAGPVGLTPGAQEATP